MDPYQFPIVICLKAPDGTEVYRRGYPSSQEQSRWDALNAAKDHATMRREAMRAFPQVLTDAEVRKVFMSDGFTLYVIPPESSESGR